MNPGTILIVMAVLFLVFGYMGVPVSFALMAGVFVGMAAATRRNDHFYLTEITKRMTGPSRSVIETANRLVVLVVSGLLMWFGWKNAVLDMGSYRMPSLMPLAVYTAIVPAAGLLIALFTIEQLVNGWQHGFEGPEDRDNLPDIEAPQDRP